MGCGSDGCRHRVAGIRPRHRRDYVWRRRIRAGTGSDSDTDAPYSDPYRSSIANIDAAADGDDCARDSYVHAGTTKSNRNTCTAADGDPDGYTFADRDTSIDTHPNATNSYARRGRLPNDGFGLGDTRC